MKPFEKYLLFESIDICAVGRQHLAMRGTAVVSSGRLPALQYLRLYIYVYLSHQHQLAMCIAILLSAAIAATD